MHIAELRFLTVEDHELQRFALTSILTGLGATSVFAAEDGHGALKIVRAPDPPIDIVITDLDMPGMDGMEFIRHLGEAAIPVSVILASANDLALLASVETMARTFGVKVLGAIEKPITSTKLKTLIELHKPIQPKAARAQAAVPFTLEEIAEALKKDEFEPFFQPKVDLATGRVTGAEALARWRHPHKGIVAPYAFIGLMEENGLIYTLSQAMLRKSAAFCRDWRAASGLEVTVAVNLSIKSLDNVKLAEQVTELVRNESTEPQHMVIEVTESATTTETGKVLENLSRLRMKGFGLSIDDYGTGYSSMQQLTRIAFTELKIDQSFVANAAIQDSARIILESSLAMARKLKIRSVAEGVETQENWDLLRSLGCDIAQGYFIARPMEASALLTWQSEELVQ